LLNPVRKATDLFSRYPALLPFFIFLLGTFTILYHLGTPGLFETSEGRYASIARAMLDSGDWLVPVNNGLKHLTKPPLTYWLSAMGMNFFGINEFGARFFLALAAGLTALGTYLIGKALIDKVAGLIASLVLICSLFFQVQFKGLTTDPFLAMFETFMVLGFIRFMQTRGSRLNRRWLIFFWFMAAFAMLTKGPPGLIPLAGLIPACLLSGKKQQLKTLLSSVVGWVIFTIVGLGWYLLLAIKIPGLLSYFLIDETLKRVASNAHHRANPFYMFIVLLPVGIFPWTSFFIRGLSMTVKSCKQSFVSAILSFWLLIPLLIFTLSKSKLAAYVLPLLVPVAIIAALAVHELTGPQKKDTSQVLGFHFKLNAALVVLLGTTMLAYGLSGDLHAKVLNSSLIFVGVFWMLLGTFVWLQHHFGNRMLPFALLCFVAPGLIFFSIPGIRGNEQLQSGKFLPSQWRLLKRLGNLPPEQKFININQMIEGWYFYTGRVPITYNVSRVTRFDQEKAKKLVLNSPEELNKAIDNNTMLVLKAKHLARTSEILDYNLRTIASEGAWLIAAPERRMRR
jgi:4-amino-4-deoxy-L-arabinose transferase